MVPQIKEIIKTAGFKIPKTIENEDTGEVIQVDEEKVERAISLVADAQKSIFDAAEAISTFFVEGLYLYLGLSKQEACERLFGMSVSSVRNLQLIYERLGNDYKHLSMMGVSKLTMIAHLPDEQRSELIKNGAVTLQDGSVMTVDEIAGSRIKDLENKLKAKTNEASAAHIRLKETDKAHKEEVKELRETIGDLEKLTNIPETDRAFYDKVTTKREIQNVVFEAQSYIHSAFMALGRIASESKESAAAIEGFMTMNARKLLDLEEQFGASAGYYKNTLKAMAGEQ